MHHSTSTTLSVFLRVICNFLTCSCGEKQFHHFASVDRRRHTYNGNSTNTSLIVSTGRLKDTGRENDGPSKSRGMTRYVLTEYNCNC